MPINSKIISLVKSKLRNHLKNKEILDIILFGSAIKGKAMPNDIDITIITEKNLKINRLRYKKFGRKKFPNICIVCKKTFFSIRKDRKFCSQKCISQGQYNGRWKGGRQKDSRGYIKIYSPYHPFKINKNFVLEHRLIMERHLGRFLKPEEIVHHINGKTDDNRLENLLLLKNNSEHIKLHFTPEKRKKLSEKIKNDFRTGKRIPYMLGKHHTKATKLIMSKLKEGFVPWNKGKKLSAEFRTKIKESWVKRKHQNIN